jgi:2-phospho-L-lactate guanylyltransferase
VLVPVKAFSRAKLRLASALDAPARARLARTMGETVLAAAGSLPVSVVCDDDEVADWARGAGARVLWRPGRGLNAAVDDGVAALSDDGYERIVVAHGDLPLAVELGWVARFPGVTLVPDRRDDGTNVACVPAGAARVGFRFAYGAGSFRRHAAQVRHLGLSLRVVREPRLGWDVDIPDDLTLAGLCS